MHQYLKYKYLFIVLFFSFCSVVALLYPGLPPTHDGEYHVIRFYEFDKVLRSGSIYPRWAPDLNYGYGVPLFNYVYPLPNYIASFLHLFTISFIDGFKFNMFIAGIIGGLFFYLWSKRYWGEWGGVVSSVMYSYSPYHFVDVYIRGSVGEVWAIALFPAFLWSIDSVDRGKRWIGISSLFLSCTIFSHNILALMFFIFSLTYIIYGFFVNKNKRQYIRNVTLVYFIALGSTTIFWLPAITEKSFVTGLEIYKIADNFPELYQLLIPSWGSGFSGSTSSTQMSFQIGVANITAVCGAIIYLLLKDKKKITSKPLVIFFLVWFVATIYLLLPVAKPIWYSVPLLNYFQFPWRLLSLNILITSFLGGAIFVRWNSWIMGFLAIILVVSLTIWYSYPPYYFSRDDNYYITRSNFIDGTNSPGNYFNTIWMQSKDKRPQAKFVSQRLTILQQTTNPVSYTLLINSQKNAKLFINTAYFPGWQATIGNKELPINKAGDGTMYLSPPYGEHKLIIELVDTKVRVFSSLVSLISICAMLICICGNTIYVRIKK